MRYKITVTETARYTFEASSKQTFTNPGDLTAFALKKFEDRFELNANMYDGVSIIVIDRIAAVDDADAGDE